MIEPLLRRKIFSILAAALPVAACGGMSDAADAGDAGDAGCNSCFCGQPIPPGPKYDVTYVNCSTLDTDADASGDADVSDDAEAGPPAVCFSSCYMACQSQHPTVQGGNGQCVSEDDGDGGQLVAHCQIEYLCGRRLDGLAFAERGDASAIGEALAHAAWLEAASIHAFRRLARELRAHGAPEALVVRARAAAKDEARHARVMARLARRSGAKVPRVRYEDCGVRELEAIARENAVEACVGETYGALLAMWQAEHAADAEVRAAMRAIAPDEMRHAELGWAVAAWADAQLSDGARDRVRAARNEAARALLQNATIEPDAKVASATGAPRRKDARRLASAMHAELWAA